MKKKVEKFLKRLQTLVQIEMKEEINENWLEIKRLSGAQREARGKAILGLKGKIIGEEFGYKIVKLGRAKEIVTNISSGDLVLLSRGNPLKENVKAYVLEKAKKFIVVALEDVRDWVTSRNVRVDFFANETTFKRMLAVLQEPSKMCIKAIEYALGLKKPVEPSEKDVKFFNTSLNPSQKKAVKLALGASEFFLIHGPFGTGKTTTLAEIVMQEVKHGNRVLVAAETNVAVDNLAERLNGKVNAVRIGHFSRVLPALRAMTLFAKMEEHEEFEEVLSLRKRIEELKILREEFLKPTPQLRRGLSDDEILLLAKKGEAKRGLKIEQIKSMAEWIKLSRKLSENLKKLRKLEEKIAEEIVSNCEVVLATNSSCALEFIPNDFDVAVIDEASQSMIPCALIPISKAEKFVLAGDHKQLPPTVKSKHAKELEKSLFERLILSCPQCSAMLTVQYRMNSLLMEFSSRMFYNSKLSAAENVKNITLQDILNGEYANSKQALNGFSHFLLFSKPLVFIDTHTCESNEEARKISSTSRENPLEAEIVRLCTIILIQNGVKEEDIGIITPYEDQVERLRNLLKDFEGVEISTVDAFQGREKEVIIISLVRSNRESKIGFLKDVRRLNVALTRAKRKLIVIGNSKTICVHKVYKKLVEFAKKKGSYLPFKKFSNELRDFSFHRFSMSRE